MYKLHLILKYLLKRRIAWVSLIAVMLCTTMVLVVISVMGGWLRMFRESFHGLTGDVIVEGRSLVGFPYYGEMIDQIKQLPEVEAAIPTIHTFGLINIAGQKSEGVQVTGYPTDQIGAVSRFPESLHRQHAGLLEEAGAEGVSPRRREMLRKIAQAPPSFRLRTQVWVPVEPAAVPAGAELDEGPDGRLTYDRESKRLVLRGMMGREERDALHALSPDPDWREAVSLLFDRSHRDVVDYARLMPRSRSDVTRWPGMIAGAGVLDIKKDKEGNIVGREDWKYELPATLVVMGVGKGGRLSISEQGKAERNYWIVDDSRTGLWQYDTNMVYVPFEQLQRDLGMAEQQGEDRRTGGKYVEPARTTDVQVKLKPGADLQGAKENVAAIVKRVTAAHRAAGDPVGISDPVVETWEEDKQTFLGAVENERLLVTFLFSLISVVAVFLIFCIFYMIVVEKTKDIGIIKSVGATSGGVAGIFLGYGTAIGLVGGGLGLGAAFLITRYINEIHGWLGKAFGLTVWNPEVYLFDKIPNTMEPVETAVIVACAVVSSVLGALVPALRAARMNPVEALRWE